jgi:hypothetical protein
MFWSPQVRLPGSLVKDLHVLGVKSVFECIELCIPAKNRKAPALLSRALSIYA